MIKKIGLLVAVYLLVWATLGWAGDKLSPELFNQSVNAGSEEALGIRYRQQPSYQLVLGDKPASDTGWESHSTLTTGLFPLQAGEKSYLSYMVKADNRYSNPPVLWTEIRYFDRHGVNIAIAGGKKQGVVADWRKNVIRLAPTEADVAYAEVWFVKYQSGKRTDSDDVENSDNKSDQDGIDKDKYYAATIYLSDIKLK